jgi:hypothetical protein
VILLRLIQPASSSQTLDIRQFDLALHISQIPSLILFGPGDAAITYSWIGSYPSEDDLIRRISPARPPHRTIKISITTVSRSLVHEFPSTSTIGDLRSWILSEFGDIQIIVSHSQKPLPDDDSMTLVAAGLSPNAVLRQIGAINLGEIRDLPVVRRERPPLRDNRTIRKVVQAAKTVIAILNPWNDGDDSEDFWEYSPNPEFVENVRQRFEGI